MIETYNARYGNIIDIMKFTFSVNADEFSETNLDRSFTIIQYNVFWCVATDFHSLENLDGKEQWTI